MLYTHHDLKPLLSPNLRDIVLNDFLNGGFGSGASTSIGERGGGGATALRGLGPDKCTFKGAWG